MIIWSRWGVLVLLCAGLGVGTGFAIGGAVSAVTDGGSPGPVYAGVGLLFAGLYAWLLDHFVMNHLDKPYQRFVSQPLPQPVTHPNGAVQTHMQVPVVHPQTGQPIWFKPSSSLFFVPVRFWSYILGGIGLVVVVGSTVGMLVG